MAEGISGYKQNSKIGSKTNSFSSQVLNKLPWGLQLIDNITQMNPKYEKFSELQGNRENRLNQMSVFSSPFGVQSETGLGRIMGDKRFQMFMYSNIDMDKIRRINEYRQMAFYSTVANCLDEISDELLFENDNSYVNLKITGIKDTIITEEIQNEWKNFVSIFEFKDKGWERFRRFLIEGELYFENVISQEHPELGILGLVEIPTALISPIYNNIQNNIIENFLMRRPVIDPETQNVDHEDIIAMEKNQITYVSSGLRNDDGSITLPYIENARRSYKQLSMMEDCILIYRMVHSPERYVFNIDVGNMTPPNIENYLRRLASQFWSRKSYDTSTGRPTNVYDPQSQNDAFWFPKRAGSDGSTVTTLGSTATFGQLDDLLYFQKELYRSMRVPISRLNADDGFKDGNDSTREEIRFGKYVKRIQRQFALGMKSSFYAHLKLRGLWTAFNLRARYFDIDFNISSVFEETRKQQFIDLKFGNFDKIASNEGISNTWAQKKYLALTDDEIAANREWKRTDAALNWELQQIAQAGPGWKKQMEAQKELASGAIADAMSSGIGGAGGGMETGLPPSMGPIPGGEGVPSATPDVGVPAGSPAEAGASTAIGGFASGAEDTPTPPV